MKLHYAQYPKNGFGGKCNQIYLIDIFGNRYDIVSEYDNVMEEVFYRVEDNDRLLFDSGYDLSSFTAQSPLELIAILNELESVKITKW